MIIKSHIRGGYRAAAEYLKEQGQNEKIRLVEISDPGAKNLDDAFYNMWAIASRTRCTKPLHHISINPMKDERLTDKQILAIVERCEEKYGYKMFHHQRVIVEHIKDGRQHFHVIWNRLSLKTGKPVWPGQHWKKSKQVCREMEKELGLKRPPLRRTRQGTGRRTGKGTVKRKYRAGLKLKTHKGVAIKKADLNLSALRIPHLYTASTTQKRSGARLTKVMHTGGKVFLNIPASEKRPFRKSAMERSELLAWAWENGRLDVLAQFGIILSPDYFEP